MSCQNKCFELTIHALQKVRNDLTGYASDLSRFFHSILNLTPRHCIFNAKIILGYKIDKRIKIDLSVSQLNSCDVIDPKKASENEIVILIIENVT